MARIRPSTRAIQNRINGRKGGLATAARYGKEFCQARARKAGLACTAKYGKDFYIHIKKYKKKDQRKKLPPTPVELAQGMTALLEEQQ